LRAGILRLSTAPLNNSTTDFLSISQLLTGNGAMVSEMDVENFNIIPSSIVEFLGRQKVGIPDFG
jgi:hypothetical protein